MNLLEPSMQALEKISLSSAFIDFILLAPSTKTNTLASANKITSVK